MGRYPRIDLAPGERFAYLTVIREIEPKGTNRRYLCGCDCGAETIKYMNNLRAGRSKSCGCMDDYTSRIESLAAEWQRRRDRAQATDEGRVCHTCGRFQPWERFSTNSKRPRGRDSNCLDCKRFVAMRRQFGISRADWEWIVNDVQNGGCALCGEPETLERRLSVDHDHGCCGDKRGCKNCVRGALCSNCNWLIGLAESRPRVAARFADYLARRPFASAAGDAEPVHEPMQP